MNHEKALNDLLEKTVEFNDIKDFALNLRAEGITKEECIDFFTLCLKKYETDDGPKYNVVLDVLDLVSGYCTPSKSIY